MGQRKFEGPRGGWLFSIITIVGRIAIAHHAEPRKGGIQCHRVTGRFEKLYASSHGQEHRPNIAAPVLSPMPSGSGLSACTIEW